MNERISYLCNRCRWEGGKMCSHCEKGDLFMESQVIQGLRSSYGNTKVEYRSYSEKIRKTFANPFAIKNVIFNEPATIVFWADGTKTVVKCQEGDVFDPEKGLAMAFMKKVLGNKGHYFETIKKWVPEEYYEEPVEKKRVIIGRVARVETSSDGVNAYVDLNRSVDAKKLVDMLTNTDVTASMDMVCDSWATAMKVIKEGK